MSATADLMMDCTSLLGVSKDLLCFNDFIVTHKEGVLDYIGCLRYACSWFALRFTFPCCDGLLDSRTLAQR
ncbi:hypothetical protein Nepgr_005985 [Nepenthes gracilis]|uniref:Uncharacterized protein n=1 Tax=Nepenthes gracilis TaxID=150966 RepID=A0AAD3S4K8_NEPGR|nr:hypothetical protein Nepgr_005985 [Nepenthes gracilis]